ncbi:LysR family transcriptional regulator [Pseudobdellovibrio exovorus]|uniref:LysR family transcriptional regulator n=1 Tax=Pseudobdellovibrio exovorus JSS TaxID=1184267 RepID=M4V791_9BACT|nr:LysR family transcriptional regulator [Pseudobdellovibrio exovorus]AGH95063.1 LysR family transcriptional regulator [Pseudobdellovibrio exovorus JSS]
MLNLSQLQTFVTVVSEGSMTAAADKLFLTQPAVSQQMKNMEDDLGVELIVRGSKQIKMTAQGEILYEHAKKILSLAQVAEVSIKSIGAQLRGELRIGTLNSIGLHLMSPVVSRLLKFNPDFKIKVNYAKGESLIQDYKKGELDVVVIPDAELNYKTQMADSKSQILFQEEMWLVGSGKDEFYPMTIALNEIKKIPYVHFSDEFPDFDLKLNAKVGKVQSVFESANVGTLKRVIEYGLGIGFLPASSIKKQVRSGRLNHVRISDFEYKMNFHYYYKTSSPVAETAQILFQALTGDQEKN